MSQFDLVGNLKSQNDRYGLNLKATDWQDAIGDSGDTCVHQREGVRRSAKPYGELEAHPEYTQ